MLRSMTAALALIITAGPSGAQTLDAEGAAAMQAAIAQELQRYAATERALKLHWVGEPQVIPAGDYYTLILPKLRSTFTSESADINTDAIQVKITPKSDTDYAVETTLPSRLTLGYGDTPSATITVGSQRFTGVWSTAVQGLITADVDIKDLTLTNGNEDSALSVASLTLRHALRPDGDGTWGGPSSAMLSGVTLSDPQMTYKIGELTIDTRYGRINQAQINQLWELIKHTITDANPPIAYYLPLLDGMLGDMSIAIQIRALSGNSDKESRGFDQVSITLDARDLDRETSTVSLGFKGDGLKDAAFPGPKQFMPERFDMQVWLDTVPNAAISQYILAWREDLERTKEKAQGHPDDDARHALIAAMKKILFEAIARTGTELRIERLTLDAPAASGSVTGAVRMNKNVEHSAVGEAEIMLRGLNAVASAMKSNRDAAPALFLLQLLGRKSKDANGAEQRIYKIEWAQDGRILLNGVDLRMMRGLLSKPPVTSPKTEPAQPPQTLEKD